MKNQLNKALWLLTIPLVYACGQGKPTSSESSTKPAVKSDTVSTCYTAAYDGDTAKLKINLIDSVHVEGTLLVKYAEKPQNEGTLKGSFKGDTLLVDYTFKTGTNPQEFINPLAFLKKGDSLVMGVGVIETYMGRSYFAKDKPINFERGKFTFNPIDCK